MPRPPRARGFSLRRAAALGLGEPAPTRSNRTMPPLELECYPTVEPGVTPPEIVPGRQPRAWMDAFHARHAYRCLPMNMANTSGWEILCPMAFTAEWNGGIHQRKSTRLNSSHSQISYAVFC